jgi:hypothetical protein
MTPFEDIPAWQRPEHDELVARLRKLEWMEVQPQLRDRCWENFNDRLSSQGETAPRGRHAAERYACSRRDESILPVSGARMRVARALAGRSGARAAISLG